MTTTENGQRDELVEILYCKPFPYGGAGAYMRPDANASHAMANAILAAGYRKPGTIATTEELDAAPDGIILRSGGVTYEHHDGWFHGVDGSNVVAESISLPAAILWEPEAEVAA